MKRGKVRRLQREIEYRFDSSGLYIQRAFLHREEIVTARTALSQLKFETETWLATQRRASRIHLCQDLLGALAGRLHNHEITRRVIGYPPRLLESYALNRKAGLLDLHGGASEFLSRASVRDVSARSWVQDGHLYSLRVKVLVYLDDVRTLRDGRLVYVEGSHKAAFAFHEAFPSGRAAAADLIRSISVRAGDAIWLNENLLHGTEEKLSARPRRLLAYTFGPTFMADWRELEGSSLTATGYAAADTEKSRLR